MTINVEALLKLLNALPLLAGDVAALIRELLVSRGYDLDKLLSAGGVTNEQNLVHINSEIARVEALLKAKKGGDPIVPELLTVENKVENKVEAVKPATKLTGKTGS